MTWAWSVTWFLGVVSDLGVGGANDLGVGGANDLGVGGVSDLVSWCGRGL